MLENTTETNPTTDSPNTTEKLQRLAWGFGCLFILGGLTSESAAMGFVWLAMGVVLIPPAADKIQEWTGFELTKKIKSCVIIAGVVLTFVIAAVSASESQAEDARWQKWIDRTGSIGAHGG